MTLDECYHEIALLKYNVVLIEITNYSYVLRMLSYDGNTILKEDKPRMCPGLRLLTEHVLCVH